MRSNTIITNSFTLKAWIHDARQDRGARHGRLILCLESLVVQPCKAGGDKKHDRGDRGKETREVVVECEPMSCRSWRHARYVATSMMGRLPIDHPTLSDQISERVKRSKMSAVGTQQLHNVFVYGILMAEDVVPVLLKRVPQSSLAYPIWLVRLRL
ncbi:AIG2-like protein isoform X1 [Tripterygium wilfordii]|uniref:AIG2-like protein isoform X1 n=1 Tax=Tripterygium wilfordii TaxID=458696 RepID=A0A7J7DP56_TRIWF|nr:AIG2-like protein isoform X1 [Tripterygium wilfordii]